MTDLSKLSDGDLKALSEGNLSGVSDDGLKYLHASATGAPTGPESIAEGAYHGFKRSGMSGILPGINEALDSQNPPPGKAIEGVAPMAIPVSAAPAALVKVAQAIGATAPRRIAANALLGASQGAAQDPGEGGSRLKNSAIGGGSALLASILGEGAAKEIPALASKFGHVSDSAVKDFIENPELAKQTYKQFSEEPEALNRELGDKIFNAFNGEGGINQNIIEPVAQQRGEAMAGKAIELNPSQFSGTAGEQELKRIAALTPQEPMSAGQYGPTIEPPALPEKMSVTAPQAQRLKQTLQEAADFANKQFQAGIAPKSEADAVAGSYVRKALEGGVNGYAGLTDELERAMQMKDAAKQLYGSNPVRILNNSEAIGNTNGRAIQDYLDQNAGTNFSQLADALSAGKARGNAGLLGQILMDAGAFATPKLQSPLLPLLIDAARSGQSTGAPGPGGQKLSEPLKAMQRRYSSEGK